MSTTTTDTILRIVCEVYDVPLGALRGQGRQRTLARPRIAAMGLLRRYAGLSLQEIAGALARTDHTTAISAIRRFDELRQREPDLQACERRARGALGLPGGMPAPGPASRPGHGAAQSRVRRAA